MKTYSKLDSPELANQNFCDDCKLDSPKWGNQIFYGKRRYKLTFAKIGKRKNVMIGAKN